jgi:hypothetical protein
MTQERAQGVFRKHTSASSVKSARLMMHVVLSILRTKKLEGHHFCFNEDERNDLIHAVQEAHRYIVRTEREHPEMEERLN